MAGQGANAKPALLAVAALLGVTGASEARADSGISVTADQALRFGSFVVPAAGSRTIAATGAVTSSGLMPIGSDPVGPAQFTVVYDRGADSARPISVLVQVLLAASATRVEGGVTGTLSAFTTDLPAAPSLAAGQAVTFLMANCVTRRCTQTFHVGARLDVTRTSGGASLTMQVPVNVTVLAVL